MRTANRRRNSIVEKIEFARYFEYANHSAAFIITAGVMVSERTLNGFSVICIALVFTQLANSATTGLAAKSSGE